MKRLIATFVFLLAPISAMAHPGSHALNCRSAKNSGSKQVIEMRLVRSNGTGWAAPNIQVTVDGRQFIFDTPDEMNSYGETFKDAPLGVIRISAEASANRFSIVAIPNTVKAYDAEEKPVIWALEDEKDSCSYSNSKATFQGILRGNMGQSQIDTQIMDCTLDYNSGMAC